MTFLKLRAIAIFQSVNKDKALNTEMTVIINLMLSSVYQLNLIYLQNNLKFNGSRIYERYVILRISQELYLWVFFFISWLFYVFLADP